MRGVRHIVVMVFLAGCGRIAFDPIAGDVGDAGETCAPWTAATTFTTPVRLAELASTSQEQQPHVSPDGLAIYFASIRTGSFEIYVADRGASDQAFANVRPLTEVNSSAYEVSFAPTFDQRTAYLSSQRTGNADIWVSQRAMVDQPWGAPTLEAASTPFVDYDAILSNDGLRLYWAILNWDQGVGLTDLVVATRASPMDGFGPPSLLAGLATPAQDSNPSETADGRMLVFSSSRAGDDDLYYSVRASPTAAYDMPSPVPDVNAAADAEPFVTPDGCQLWFTSDRAGDFDIYVADVIR